MLMAAGVAVARGRPRPPRRACWPCVANVHLFYYSWYGSPTVNGSYRHWPQGGHTPPGDIGANLYPTLGPYLDSGDVPRVVAQHMAWSVQSGRRT
jgi:hypothetical protein